MYRPPAELSRTQCLRLGGADVGILPVASSVLVILMEYFGPSPTSPDQKGEIPEYARSNLLPEALR